MSFCKNRSIYNKQADSDIFDCKMRVTGKTVISQLKPKQNEIQTRKHYTN